MISSTERRLIPTERVVPRFSGSRRRRRSLRRRPLFTVFLNCNKMPLCSESSSPPRRQREKGSCISLRFSAGDDDGDNGDNDDDTMSFLRRDAVLPLFSCYRCVPASSARMEIRSASRSSSFSPSIRRARAMRISGLKQRRGLLSPTT